MRGRVEARETLDRPRPIHERREESLPPRPRRLQREHGVVALAVLDEAFGDEPVEDLPERDGRVVLLDDLGGALDDRRPRLSAHSLRPTSSSSSPNCSSKTTSP